MGRRWLVAAASAALIGAGVWNLVPHSPPPTATAPIPAWRNPAVTQDASPSASVPSETRTPQATRSPARASCLVGDPTRLRIPTLGVDAPFEHIGLDPNGRRDSTGTAPLGTPTDRTKAGWYAAGPKPGSGTGTVLIDGHTYLNGSAIFKNDFASRIATGQLIQLRQDNGSVCSYRITNVWRTISSAHAYPALVTSQHLYDFTGPERLLLVTCGGTFDPAIDTFDDINVVLAVPVGT